LRKHFRPEFINRVDEIIIFDSLSLEDVMQIVNLQMKDIAARLEEQGLAVELTGPAREWLARQGYDPQFGARPLRRALQRFVESPLSVQLLKGEFKPGDLVIVDVGEEGVVFHRREGAAPHLIPADDGRPPAGDSDQTDTNERLVVWSNQ